MYENIENICEDEIRKLYLLYGNKRESEQALWQLMAPISAWRNVQWRKRLKLYGGASKAGEETGERKPQLFEESANIFSALRISTNIMKNMKTWRKHRA
jgi:hypothetical protein